jgi:hypothetical protein
MSKRVRGTVRSHRRPGTRAPTERTAAARRAIAAARPSQLEAAEEIAEDVVEQRPASAAGEPGRVVRTTARTTHHRIKPGSVLAARAATEYVYVAQDFRRIVLVAAGLIGLLFVLWLAVVVMRVIPLPFY